MGQMLVEREAALREVLEWEAGLQALHAHIALRFSRSESRQRVLAYLQGLLGSVERKNGWQLAEYAGDATPDGVQRLLAVYHWTRTRFGTTCKGTCGAFGRSRRGAGIETGFLKQGQKSDSTAARRGRWRTVRSGYSWPMAGRGAAFHRELYLPQEWAADWVRRQEAGVPEGVAFRKAQLAHRPRGGGWRALCLGNWGYCTAMTRLRRWLEEHGVMCWR